MQLLSNEQYQWISQQFPFVNYQALCGDAGFRRYFRLHTPAQSLIFMDASEEPLIYRAFVQQSQHLSHLSPPFPRLLAKDDDRFWAVLEDFGDDLLFQLFLSSENPEQLADVLYKEAIDHLLILHQQPIKAFGRLAILDTHAILEELLGWQEWCVEGLFQHTLSSSLEACFNSIAQHVTQQPYIFMHRDFHSKNLLRKADGCIGIIDYQDAMSGPITYDIASLLRDCYVDWPEPKVISWVLYYKEQAQQCGLLGGNVSDATFLHWFDWTGVQRHLKALFTFSRKYLRDKDDRYLQFISRTLGYLDAVCSRYEELEELTKIIRLLKSRQYL